MTTLRLHSQGRRRPHRPRSVDVKGPRAIRWTPEALSVRLNTLYRALPYSMGEAEELASDYMLSPREANILETIRELEWLAGEDD